MNETPTDRHQREWAEGLDQMAKDQARQQDDSQWPPHLLDRFKAEGPGAPPIPMRMEAHGPYCAPNVKGVDLAGDEGDNTAVYVPVDSRLYRSDNLAPTKYRIHHSGEYEPARLVTDGAAARTRIAAASSIAAMVAEWYDGPARGRGHISADLIDRRLTRFMGGGAESLSQFQPITMTYRNFRGEVSDRTIIPTLLWWGATDWHPEPGWLLTAYDLEKGSLRDFALADADFRRVAGTARP